MKVFIAVGLKKYYFRVEQYLQIVEKRRKQDNVQRTMFLWMEDVAADPNGKRSAFRRIVDFMYPGGHNFSYPGDDGDPSIAAAATVEPKLRIGHATDPDLDLKTRLLGIVREHDRNIFGGRIAAINSLIGSHRSIPELVSSPRSASVQ
jgi:hypothetical protein